MRHLPRMGDGRLMRFELHTIGGFAQAFKAVAMIAAVATLAGCSMTGRGLDETAVGAIAIVDADAPLAGDPFRPAENAEGAARDRLLDEDTIRNAVTSANLKEQGDTVQWANQSTGSKGTITGLEQRKVSGQVCRSFNATRESYDGVTLYRGDLCLDRRTGWWTRMLTPAGSGKNAG
ncbi:MAG: hypothetical protein CL535_07165 [Ahrensia sp.]|nr:hypothetical protein [Ahrensia sp.]